MERSSQVTLTEVGAEKREQALRAIAEKHGWGLVTGDKSGMDDSGIMWKEKDFFGVASGTHILSGYTYEGKGGGVVYAAWAVLQHENHKTLVLVAHQASGVERGGGLKGAARRVRKWRKDTKALKQLWNKLADKYDVDSVQVTCDWNVNIKNPFFRALFRRMYPGMNRIVHKPWPARGTLGDRLVDFTFIRGDISGRGVVVMPLNNSSDHKPFRQTVTIY
jgi:hypothetical protein